MAVIIKKDSMVTIAYHQPGYTARVYPDGGREYGAATELRVFESRSALIKWLTQLLVESEGAQ